MTALSTPTRSQLTRRRARRWLRGWTPLVIAELAALLLLWQLAATTLGLLDPAFLPPPLEILQAFRELIAEETFLSSLWFTVKNYVIGFVVASVLGVTLGLMIGWFQLLNKLFAPLAWLAYSVPKVAIAPVVILGLGLGATSKIAMVFLLVVFVVLTNTMEGARTVDRSYVWAGRVFGYTKWQVLRRIVMPAAAPYIFAALERAVILGMIGEILAEYLGSKTGIGVTLQRAAFDFRMDDAMAVVLVMVIVTITARMLLRWAIRWFAPWYVASPIGRPGLRRT